MKGLLITEKGMESTAAEEVMGLIAAKTKVEERGVIIETQKVEELFKLCYLSQSAFKVLLLFEVFKADQNLANTILNLKQIADSADYSLLPRKFSFRVNCDRVGEHNYGSLDVETEAGAVLVEIFKNCKVSMESPDLIFYVFINDDKGYFCLDLAGVDLSKRAYKIFNHPQALKGPVAYHLVRLAKVKKDDVILDPFCGSGVIPIEAALYLSGFPVRYYDKDMQFLKLKKVESKKFFSAIDRKIKKGKTKIHCLDKEFHYINAAKKNAKIAGIDKLMVFSRLDVEWLDTKFEAESVDAIITDPPQASARNNAKDVEKVYNELFYQADFVLKKKGKIILICANPALLKKHAAKHGFKQAGESEVWSGSQKKNILEFSKDLNTEKRNR